MLQLEIIGNLGADAEVKKINDKENVAFNVAHSEVQKDENGGTSTTTRWVSVLWWGNGGGVLPYLKKGTKVFVRGKLRTNLYQNKEGKWEVGLSIYANEVQLCGSSTSEGSPTTANV